MTSRVITTQRYECVNNKCYNNCSARDHIYTHTQIERVPSRNDLTSLQRSSQARCGRWKHLGRTDTSGASVLSASSNTSTSPRCPKYRACGEKPPTHPHVMNMIKTTLPFTSCTSHYFQIAVPSSEARFNMSS